MSARDVFSRAGDDSFTRYAVELQVTNQLVGGIPKNPDMIRSWVKSRLDLGDRELVELTNETALAVQSDEGEARTLPTDELLDRVAEQIEGGNTFKRVDGMLIYEGRCAKSMLREAANVAYPGRDWPGKPAGIRKGLMRFFVERVFVEQDAISLGVTEPSWTEQRIKHVITAAGPRSAINVVDLVDKPRLEFTVAVLDDCLTSTVWRKIWESGEHIGIGADRARGDGRFTLERWEKIT